MAHTNETSQAILPLPRGDMKRFTWSARHHVAPYHPLASSSPPPPPSSRRRILANNLLDPPLVLRAVSLEHVVRLGLGGGLRVGVVEEVLDAEEDLLDRDGRLPRLFLVQDREAHRAGRVDVGVEERRHELACKREREKPHVSVKFVRPFCCCCLLLIAKRFTKQAVIFPTYTWEAWWDILLVGEEEVSMP